MMRILQLDSLLSGGGTDDQCVKLAARLRPGGTSSSPAAALV
jgi:hypothetical protein